MRSYEKRADGSFRDALLRTCWRAEPARARVEVELPPADVTPAPGLESDVRKTPTGSNPNDSCRRWLDGFGEGDAGQRDAHPAVA